jgi:hypothetical protein
MFQKNEGPVDRVIRVAAGILLLPTGLFLLGGLGGSVVGIVVSALGLIGLVTGATGRCPTYVPFGITTVGRRTVQPLIERGEQAA